jgi:ATP-dependent exoDNAse (exonuclease V) beta subunit
MDRNWRSDPHAVAAMNTLFRAGSRAFDEAAFDYVEVKNKKPARLDPPRPGLDVRWVDARVTGGNEGERITKKTRALSARLAAREAAAWLNGQRSRIVWSRTQTWSRCARSSAAAAW